MTDRDLIRVLGEAFRRVGEQLLQETAFPAPPPRKEPRFMPVSAYAKSRGYAASTVRAWVALGLPVAQSRRGFRVEVALADEWLRAGGASQAVERIAHGRA